MIKILASALLILPLSGMAQVYKTLPKGVRLLAYRNVTTSKINATYNQAQAESPLSYDINANSKSLEKIGGGIQVYFEQLKATSPEAYKDFSAGQFDISAQAQVHVDGLGMGYGLTDRLTFYSILPYYQATVQMKYKQTKKSNLAQVADDVYSSGGGDISSTLGAIANEVDSVASGNLMQSVVVNTFGYKELGTWQGSGYGDLELGTVYKLLDKGYYGFALTSGTVLPTGREDDPDILQDIGFGDGQFDFFAELDSGYSISDKLMVGNTLRYTYQAPTQKDLRIPYSQDLTISDRKGNFDVKYGDKIDTVFLATYQVNDWFSVTPAYEFNYQMSSTYDSQYGDANEILAMNSDRYAHVGKFTGTISSVTPFLKKEFLLPATINVNVQQTLAGKNVPKVGRFEVELRMMF
jgi:hypothetical protein